MNIKTSRTPRYFIHTFSFECCLSYSDAEKLWTTYSSSIIKNDNGNCIITHFSKNGLRIVLEYRTANEIRFDKDHAEIKVEWIVTPYKVLHEGEPMGTITDMQDMEKVIVLLKEMCEAVINDSHIATIKKIKLKRVDLTLDVATPSQAYTHQILDVCKATALPYGYTFWNMTEYQREQKGWDERSSCLYQNKSCGIQGKIYDKNKNLQDFNYPPVWTGSKSGLLRFEITLKRKLLKKLGYWFPDEQIKTIYCIMRDADALFEKYFLEIFDNGDMLSTSLYDKYIRQIIKTSKNVNDMKMLNNHYVFCRKNRTEFMPEDFPRSQKVLRRILKLHQSIGLSPISLSEDCPYIPSFRKMFHEEVDEILFNFAMRRTRGKEYWNEL